MSTFLYSNQRWGLATLNESLATLHSLRQMTQSERNRGDFTHPVPWNSVEGLPRDSYQVDLAPARILLRVRGWFRLQLR